MKSYNGFTAEQRTRAGRWLRKQWAAGTCLAPTQCCACGQSEGVLDAHAEDYSEPYGPHVGQFPLCFRCHMLLHCRFRARTAWDYYRAQVRAGWRYEPIRDRSFKTIQEQLQGRQPARARFDPPFYRWLDEIELGLHKPRAGLVVRAPASYLTVEQSLRDPELLERRRAL